VSDFGTPVQTVTAAQSGDRVRMTIQSAGLWEHSAYQSNNQLVIEIRQKKVNPNKLTQGPGYQGEKLSLNFQNIDVRSVLQVIADFTNFNIVTTDTVQGNLTLRLQDVPWDQALDIILQAKGLGMKRVGNVLQIAPKEELAAKEKAELQAQADIANLEPLRTQSFQLNYTKAADVAVQLNANRTTGGSGGANGAGQRGGGLLSARGSVIAEPRTNQLFISDVPTNLAQIQELITKLDVPMRQVLIEARIVEATDGWGNSLGVRLGGTNPLVTKIGGGNQLAIGGTYDSISATTGQPSTGSGSATANSFFVNMPAASVLGAAPSNFALSLFSSSAERFLNLEISALEADQKGKVISSPRVVTADQTKAIIEQGTQVPYVTQTAGAQNVIPTVSFKQAALKLEVTPQITPEGNIILDLDVTKDTVDTSITNPPIATKHVKTQVLVENGGTVVIGGIYEIVESQGQQKVPLIGDIPVLGNLFKNNQRLIQKDEVLIFITPKMISDHGAMR
jgi:type IV pilus assembly protein PilQ